MSKEVDGKKFDHTPFKQVLQKEYDDAMEAYNNPILPDSDKPTMHQSSQGIQFGTVKSAWGKVAQPKSSKDASKPNVLNEIFKQIPSDSSGRSADTQSKA